MLFKKWRMVLWNGKAKYGVYDSCVWQPEHT